MKDAKANQERMHRSQHYVHEADLLLPIGVFSTSFMVTLGD
jgi:hypothetical protein